MSPSLIDDNLIQKNNKSNICAMFFLKPKLLFKSVFVDKKKQ